MRANTELALLLMRELSGGNTAVLRTDAEHAALCEAAIEHGVEGLLWDALDGSDGAAPFRAVLEPMVRAAVARELFVSRNLNTTVAALTEGGVPVLVTKGSALAYTVYKHPWLRPRVDTDLLVRQTDVAAAGRILQNCGYVRSAALSTGELVSHQIAFERTDANDVRHVIDLHWKIVNPQVLADTMSFDDLFRDAGPALALGPGARVPSAIGSLALGCVHRLAHHQGHDRLVWLYDFKLLAAELNDAGWLTFQQFACRHRIAGLCLDGLRAARSRLDARLPAEVEQALAAAAPTEPSRMYLEGPVRKRDVLMSDLKVLGSWSERMRLMREHAFPPAAFIQQRYGTQARWLLPALYLHRLITGAARWGRS